MKTLRVLFFLSGVTLVFHWQLIASGLGLLHSDFAPGLLVANEFRNGNWSAFYFDMTYGGTSLGVLRAVWVSLWEWFFANDPSAWISSQMSFTYGVCPVLMTVGTYFLACSFVSSFGAFWVGLMAAMGFHDWIIQYGNDVYFGYLFLGFILLAWRSRLNNPFLELSQVKLFLAAILCGLAAYTSRAALIYGVVFFLPWNEFISKIKNILIPTDRLEKILLWAAFLCFLLFLYLEIFGPALGTMFGRSVRLHAHPNLNFALMLLCVFLFKRYWKFISQEVFYRTLIVVLGLIVGFLPELVHWLRLGQLPPPGMGGSRNFAGFFEAFGTLPQSLMDLVCAGDGAGRNASLVLFIGGTLCFLKGSRQRKFIPPMMVAIFSIYAYCRIFTYTGANSRYLLPLLPVLLVAVGCFWDWVVQKKWPIFCLSLALLFFHGVHHWNARVTLIQKLSTSQKVDRMEQVIQLFRKATVTVVLSDDYWHSNQYTFLSQLNPYFIFSEPIGPRHPEGVRLALKETRVGILLRNGHPLQEGVIQLAGRKWTLKYLGSVGDRELFVGEVH